MTDAPAGGRMVEIDLAKLVALISETPFTFAEFQGLVGWNFSMGDAPREKRALAWKILTMPKEQLQHLRELQMHFPQMWVGDVINMAGKQQ